MGRTLRRRGVDATRRNYDDTCEEKLIEEKSTGKPRLSLKDATVIIIMSTVLSISLVTVTVGIQGIRERLDQNDLSDVLLTIVVLICLFTLLSYLLVKIAAHYVVYLAVATFCGIVFPVSPHKQRTTIRQLYDKANK